MDTVNVFGGSGFVGSHFCSSRNVIANERSDLEPKTSNIVYFISTIDNYNVLKDPLIDIETNLSVLMKVLSKCKKGSTFNFISSWFVYGDTELPAREDSACNPKGFYSITKRTAELLLISYCKTFGINYRILRLGNVIGPNDKKASKKRNAVTFLINEIKNNRPISLYDGGNFDRDYVHVKDVVDAINLIVDNGKLNEIYNVGNGVPTLFKDVIDYALTKTNYTNTVSSIEIPEFHKIVQIKSMYMDNTKLKSLGYKNKFTIFDFVDDIFKDGK